MALNFKDGYKIVDEFMIALSGIKSAKGFCGKYNLNGGNPIDSDPVPSTIILKDRPFRSAYNCSVPDIKVSLAEEHQKYLHPLIADKLRTLKIISNAGLFGIIDENNKVVLPFNYPYITPFEFYYIKIGPIDTFRYRAVTYCYNIKKRNSGVIEIMLCAPEYATGGKQGSFSDDVFEISLQYLCNIFPRFIIIQKSLQCK